MSDHHARHVQNVVSRAAATEDRRVRYKFGGVQDIPIRSTPWIGVFDDPALRPTPGVFLQQSRCAFPPWHGFFVLKIPRRYGTSDLKAAGYPVEGGTGGKSHDCEGFSAAARKSGGDNRIEGSRESHRAPIWPI